MLQSSAQFSKGKTLMRQTLIMCVHESWVSSQTLSRLAVSKSWPESVCVLITPYSRLNLLHLLQCAINIHMAEPTHCSGLIACLKMSPRCSRENGEDEGDKGKLWLHKCETCEIYLPPLQLSLLFCENSQSFP